MVKTRKKSIGRTTPSKPSFWKSRKMLVSAGVAAGILGGVFWGVSEKSKPTPKTFMETEYAAKAFPVIKHVANLVKSGEVRVVYSNIPGFNAKYTRETRTLTLPKKPVRMISGFNLFHEGSHVITYQHSTEDPLIAFLRNHGALKHLEEEHAAEVTISDEVAKKYAEKFNGVKSIPKNYSELEALKAEINSKVLEYKEKSQVLHCLTEIHSNLFDVHGVFSDDNFFYGLKKSYPDVSQNLSREKFDKIKRALLGLYCKYEGDAVHLSIAKFIGKNGSTFDEFINNAQKEASDVTKKDILRADEERKTH